VPSPQAPSDGRLVLASGSPQRRAILEQLGLEFRIEVPGVEELTPEAAGGDFAGPRALVAGNALRKVRAVAERRGAGGAGGEPGERILGVDTAVVLDGRVFGKPRDREEAETFLRRLSGRAHEVMSGIALRRRGDERTAVAVTRVRFRLLERRELDWYLASGEWRDRAGAYAIQGRGAALVAEIEGDYWNVVGLPVPALIGLAPELLSPPQGGFAGI
jgi:septum formation protein